MVSKKQTVAPTHKTSTSWKHNTCAFCLKPTAKCICEEDEKKKKQALDQTSIELNRPEAAQDPRASSESTDRFPYAQKGTEPENVRYGSSQDSIEEMGWYKIPTASDHRGRYHRCDGYSHYNNKNLPGLRLEVTNWGFTLFEKRIPVQQGELFELDGFLQGLKGKTAARNVQTFAPNVTRQLRHFDKMPSRFKDEPWLFNRKRRERGKPPVAHKFNTTPSSKPRDSEVEFHETPTKLPPRNDMRRHLDEDVKEEIKQDTISGGTSKKISSENIEQAWNALTPKGRCKLLGVTGKPTSMLFFRPWVELDSREQNLINHWLRSKQAMEKVATDNWLDFISEQEEDVKLRFMSDPRMKEMARMEGVDMEALWSESKDEYLKTFHDPLP
jgi:hypothetical protein